MERVTLYLNSGISNRFFLINKYPEPFQNANMKNKTLCNLKLYTCCDWSKAVLSLISCEKTTSPWFSKYVVSSSLVSSLEGVLFIYLFIGYINTLKNQKQNRHMTKNCWKYFSDALISKTVLVKIHISSNTKYFFPKYWQEIKLRKHALGTIHFSNICWN